MKRSLIASTAIAATLGFAGLALAQTSPTPGAAPTTSTTPGATTGMSPPSLSSPSTTQTAPMPDSTTGQSAPGVQASTSPTTVRKVQEKLQAQGLYEGPVDGKMGEKTQTAISQYQRKAGLPQTAMLDQQTLDHLLTGWSSTSGTGTSSGAPTSHHD